MDKYSTLEPVRLHGSHPTAISVGKLPTDLHIFVLSHLPIPDFPAYARCSQATASLARTEKIWQARLEYLGEDTQELLDQLNEALKTSPEMIKKTAGPATIAVDDEFGDFEGGDISSIHEPEEMADFVGAFDNFAVVTPVAPAYKSVQSQYIRAHNLLKPLLKTLISPPHLILTALDHLTRAQTLMHRARILRLLARFLSPKVMPIRNFVALSYSLRGAIDRFDANLLAAFEAADSKNSERGMREAAQASWTVFSSSNNAGPGGGDWEMGKVWAEKREIFYEQSKWDPMANFTEGNNVTLAFDAMDEFMSDVVAALNEHGQRCVRVFPRESGVLLSFAERIANEVVGEYITSLLTRARELSNDKFLVAAAATFREASRMVDAIMHAASASASIGTYGDESSVPYVTKTNAEDIIYQMFEVNMDEYLDEEVESARQAFESITKSWSSKQSAQTPSSQAAFLSSQNPALMKRNVISSFTSVLLLPVTIVPKAVDVVGGAVGAVGYAAVQGISMLNPQKWGGGTGMSTASSDANGSGKYDNAARDDGDAEIFNVGDDDEDAAEDATSKRASTQSQPNNRTSNSTTNGVEVQSLDLFISLDVALELIHADRDSLKRVETFSDYPGHYGHRVRDTMEEIFILMLHAIGEGHTTRGFKLATEQMARYKPAEHDGASSNSVAPLVQFFELVHIGDTIQSMVQVYFDKELAPHIDRTDFLNAVVREKGRFENGLDDCVAAGLNAGTDVLMTQVDHIILTLTQPREYYPPDDAPMELGPTKGCVEAIKCLDTHCKLLKGSTSKEVLEVFYQEIGIRLIAILQKHIKRQIISLSGGFQVIADLNTYHTFIASLKVPSIAAEFAHLKMLGHVYVVEDAKDLAQIVRDVTRYGGAYRPEDIYEFIQRRSDWKKIEKTVDKAMYNLSFKEDCIVC